MLLIATLNLVGRYVINILAEPIRNELGLIDSQIGLVTGLAFALFYTFAGIPIARLADRGNRPMIISASIVVWSAFTALSGFAQNFMHLFLARIGVGAGEAGCTPPSHSLITDYAPVEKRAAALAVFQMGAPLGSMIGLAVGGHLRLCLWLTHGISGVRHTHLNRIVAGQRTAHGGDKMIPHGQ
jgi:MFS family permease